MHVAEIIQVVPGDPLRRDGSHDEILRQPHRHRTSMPTDHELFIEETLQRVKLHEPLPDTRIDGLANLACLRRGSG